MLCLIYNTTGEPLELVPSLRGSACTCGERR
mgnify:CR=1 FL=1